MSDYWEDEKAAEILRATWGDRMLVSRAVAEALKAERDACAAICDAIERQFQEAADRIHNLPSNERVVGNAASSRHLHAAEGSAYAARLAAYRIRSRGRTT